MEGWTDGQTAGQMCLHRSLCFLLRDPPEIRLSVSDDQPATPAAVSAASEPTAVPEVHVETVSVLSSTQCRVRTVSLVLQYLGVLLILK